MFQVNDRCTRTWCEICSNLTIKTPKRRHWRRSDVFFVNFEHISSSIYGWWNSHISYCSALLAIVISVIVPHYFRTTCYAMLLNCLVFTSPKSAAETAEQNIKYVSTVYQIYIKYISNMYQICFNWTTSTSCSSVFLVNFQEIPHLMREFLLFTLNI